MLWRKASFLCLCIAAMQLLHISSGLQVDPEYRAQMERKVMAEMSLRDLEAMVENDERVMNLPKKRIVIIPGFQNRDGQILGQARDAFIIERKPKKSFKKYNKAPDYKSKFAFHHIEDEEPEYKFPRYSDHMIPDYDSGLRRASYEPFFDFEYKREEEYPSFFKMSELESAGSDKVQRFYEAVVESVLGKQDFGIDPLEAVQMAESADVPQYKPRFDYDAYTKDSTETKLQGKPYWKETPERREEMLDENGCRTVIKKVVDPEDEKKSSNAKAKSVVITKECESPNLNGPDAKIVEARPFKLEPSRLASAASGFSSFGDKLSSYENTRPEELSSKKTDGNDPIASDYIDTMLEQHFKGFPGFVNPLSSFSGYQERFKLRAPEAFLNIKPTVGVQSYEYSHPKSGFENDERQQDSVQRDSAVNDEPKIYEHHYNYDYPAESPRKALNSKHLEDSKDVEKTEDEKEPKMMKKSFAYYRKDNPKSDPDDHQYAEEYGTGNYRSFSSSYDSEKDGQNKKKQ